MGTKDRSADMARHTFSVPSRGACTAGKQDGGMTRRRSGSSFAAARHKVTRELRHPACCACPEGAGGHAAHPSMPWVSAAAKNDCKGPTAPQDITHLQPHSRCAIQQGKPGEQGGEGGILAMPEPLVQLVQRD